MNGIDLVEDPYCSDCGDDPCTCAERCSGCMQKFQCQAEEEAGMCGECLQDALESNDPEGY